MPPSTPMASLSPREAEVPQRLVDGKSNQEIAAELFISPRTVTNHVVNIMHKLGVESRTGWTSRRSASTRLLVLRYSSNDSTPHLRSNGVVAAIPESTAG